MAGCFPAKKTLRLPARSCLLQKKGGYDTIQKLKSHKKRVLEGVRSSLKKFLSLAVCCTILLGLFTGCSSGIKQNQLSAVELSSDAFDAAQCALHVAVLYDSSKNDDSWEDLYSRLCQPLLLGMTAEAVDVSQGFSLDGFDILYPDESIMDAANADALRDAICAFAEAGGGVFLTNGFYDFFDRDFLGAKKFYPVESYPHDMAYPEVDGDLQKMQTVTQDFYKLYSEYDDFESLEGLDCGVGMKPSTAVALCTSGELALSTVNQYGAGYVFLASGLLPNPYCISGTMLAQRDETQLYLSDTAMSAARLLESSFAAFCLERTVGFSAWRVYGAFGNPTMSWELHFEEMGGFADGSGVAFAELCKKYSQIPSYTVVRNTYTWFSRNETVTTLLGESADELSFSMDLYENAYSSGAHVAAGETWISQAVIEDGGSYFKDYPEYDLRAYPDVCDLDGDGTLDLLCGSSDGALYFYRGKGYEERLLTEPAAALTDANGTPLSVSGYSAPVTGDLNGDGILDILCGAADGKVYYFRGLGGLAYAAEGAVADTGLGAQVLPDWGDLNGDGYADLVCGSNAGQLLVLYGTADGLPASDFAPIAVSGVSGSWMSPRIYDVGGDGTADLLLGTFDGYIAILRGDGAGGFASDGFIELDEQNYKGNYNAKFGNNCVPVMADINGDGIDDLVCGSLEYGLAYPIDSPYFPYREELAEQLSYFKENHIYTGVHFYTSAYSSAEREAYELDKHLESLRSYGVDTDRIGTNQHTWYTSSLSPTQSFLAQWEAGLLWNTGYAAPNDPYPYPQNNAHSIISLPFFLTQDGEWTILLQNCASLLYADDSYPEMSARYGMPMCVYYHCDFTAEDSATAEQKIQQVQAFREKYGYSFVMENQLASAVAAAINLDLSIEQNGSSGFDITLTGTGGATDFPLYSEAYQNACGVRLSFGEAMRGRDIRTDADIWYWDGDDLCIGLNRPVRVYEATDEAGDEAAHLTLVNLPADVTADENGVSVAFAEGGYMEVETSVPSTTASEGWSAQESADGGTRFTKYGAADALVISYGE